jgi:formate hydrogenlyase subunit 5
MAVELTVDPAGLAATVAAEVRGRARFAGLVASARPDGSTILRVLLARRRRLTMIEARLPAGEWSYPALTPLVPPAAWYEREIYDLFGVEPSGHPRLDSLVLPLGASKGASRPRPGGRFAMPPATVLHPGALPAHVVGEGTFTIPYGPVRSGVFESVEYLVETFGEDIPHLRTRVYHKHRGLERRFEALTLDDAVLLAERVEGTASVAHAMAYCQAVEALSGAQVPRPAELVRVVHAELERVACHLDSMIRHTEGAGQAVAYSRMTLHKERLMRLRSRLCGHRFGRGVVVLGGVGGPPERPAGEALADVNSLARSIEADSRALMATPSFLDRLRGTGVLSPEEVAQHGALGPVGRGSGLPTDVRIDRPYGAYSQLGFEEALPDDPGDALARQRVRLTEISESFHLVRQGLDELAAHPAGPWQAPVPLADGVGVGWVEAPQGELLYLVEVEQGSLVRVKPRSASFHNLALFPNAFRGDILTDFVFIEASFGLSVAGVAG